jgi:hypothetical protein
VILTAKKGHETNLSLEKNLPTRIVRHRFYIKRFVNHKLEKLSEELLLAVRCAVVDVAHETNQWWGWCAMRGICGGSVIGMQCGASERIVKQTQVCGQ